MPLAVWPHDPLNLLEVDDPAKHYLEVIDRNQNEDE